MWYSIWRHIWYRLLYDIVYDIIFLQNDIAYYFTYYNITCMYATYWAFERIISSSIFLLYTVGARSYSSWCWFWRGGGRLWSSLSARCRRMDWLEISYTAMCPTNDCPVCECPRDELDRTNTTYELRSGAKIKSMVEAAQAELLNPDGRIKNSCKTKVSIA